MSIRIIRIEDIPGFEAIRSDWDAAWKADPGTGLYSSWGWLRGWIAATSSPWLMLGAIPAESRSPVAFLPLALATGTDVFGLGRRTGIRLAGAPMADHARLVCMPGFAVNALPALAEATEELMQETGATHFSMGEVADPRLETLVDCFDRRRFFVRNNAPSSCPRIPLPRTWEEYMQGSKKRRALLRRAEHEGFVVDQADEGTLDRYTEIFLELHQMRHGPRSPGYLAMMTSLLQWTHLAGALRLLVLWKGDRPAAAHVGFVDPVRGTFHAYNGGWDEWFKKYSPPRIIELYSIRQAIEQGIREYDLGRGGEGYKFGYGAVEHLHANKELLRRTPYQVARELVRRVPQLFTSGRSGQNDDRAERGTRSRSRFDGAAATMPV